MAAIGLYAGTSMPDRGWWAAMFPDPEGILRALGVEPGMTVLDLCCGDGYFTAPLARMVAGKVHALDLDATLVEKAKAEVVRQGASVASWLVADARAADALLPARVDHVLLANIFHGVDDRQAPVATMARCLKNGGRVGVLNWRPLPREETVVWGEPRGPAAKLRMPSSAVVAIMEQGGLTAERMVDVPPYHYGLVAQSAYALN